jgi:MFS transporter, OFA family, oxalate/formate antiporter
MNTVKLFGMPAKKGRWLMIPLGMTVLLCLGTVYSWSIFRKPLEQLLNLNATQSLLPFTTLLLVFALIMPITGFYIDRVGTRTLTAVGGAIMGLGYILSSFSTNLAMLILNYGVLAGIGVGMAYGIPLAVAAKWFPDKKGLAVGLTVIGFGLSPLVTAPLANSLINSFGIQATFIFLGMVFTGIILAISTVLQMPPAEWNPVKENLAENNSSMFTGVDKFVFGNRSMLETKRFYGLWICYTIGTFVGLAAIGISSPLAQEIIKLDAGTAAVTVSLFAVFNGAGRPFFGWLTDRTNPKITAIAAYVLIIIGSIMMLSATEGSVATYIVAFSLFTFSFGGWLAIAPTSTLILFRTENYAKNYGIVFTAFGAGALGGTLAAGSIRDVLGSYTAFFYPTCGLAMLGIVLAVFLLKRPSLNAIAEIEKSTAQKIER